MTVKIKKTRVNSAHYTTKQINDRKNQENERKFSTLHYKTNDRKKQENERKFSTLHYKTNK